MAEERRPSEPHSSGRAGARSRAGQAPVRVSAIIVAQTSGSSFDLCLRAALNDPWIDELVLVDDCAPRSLASSLRGLAADRRDVTLVRTGLRAPAGYARAANAAAERARGRLLLFLDPNVAPQQGAVERMVAAGRTAKAPWIIGGKLIDTGGRERSGPRADPLTPWTAFVELLGGAARPNSAAAPRSMASVSGAMMLAPKANFLALGGFDADGLVGSEDIDLCRRFAEVGGEIVYQPRAEAVRFGSAAPDSPRGLSRYFRKAARSPAERLQAAAYAPFFGLAGLARGLWKRFIR